MSAYNYDRCAAAGLVLAVVALAGLSVYDGYFIMADRGMGHLSSEQIASGRVLQ